MGEAGLAAPTVHAGVIRGRPRSDAAHRAILDATRDLIIQFGFEDLHLEHVAARAGVGKATIYRRWPSKEALALDLLMELATPHLPIQDLGNTRAELTAAVDNVVRALTETAFGPVMKAMMSQIAINPQLGEPFREQIVQVRRTEIELVVRRGIARRDLRPDVDLDTATELLVGPVYFRLIVGGQLDSDFAQSVVDAVIAGYRNSRRTHRPR